MSARDRLIELITVWHEEGECTTKCPCSGYRDTDTEYVSAESLAVTEADEILANHAHELAERIRALKDAQPSHWAGVRIDVAADLIEPEVDE